MMNVGITGGIGSGKSVVGQFFTLMGIPVFNADSEGKNLTNTSSVIYDKLTSIFGVDIYLPDHTIDRKKLAALIFNDENLLKQVNDIIHPEVHKAFHEWSEQQTAPFVLYEAAILFESGYYTKMDYNILVLADENVRIKRVVERDAVTEEQVRQRITNQWPDDKKIKLSDFVIRNNEKDLIIPQVLEIIKTIKTDG